jgi:DNA-directed RNA polymerase specialized sigma24 family protein
MNVDPITLDSCTDEELIPLLRKALRDSFRRFPSLWPNYEPEHGLGELYARVMHAKVQLAEKGQSVHNLGGWLYECARNVWRDAHRDEQKFDRLAGKSDLIPALHDESCDEPIVVCVKKEAVERADAVIHREVCTLQPKDQAIANGILELVVSGDSDRALDREALARRFQTTPGGLRQAIHRISSGCYLRVREELGDDVYRFFHRPNLNSTDVLLALADEADCDGVAHAAIAIKLVEDHFGRLFSDRRNLTEPPDPRLLDGFVSGKQYELMGFHAVRVRAAAAAPAVSGYADIMGAFLRLHGRVGGMARLRAGERVFQCVYDESWEDALFRKGVAALAGQNDRGPALHRYVHSFLESRWRERMAQVLREKTYRWGDKSYFGPPEWKSQPGVVRHGTATSRTDAVTG